MKTQNKYKIRYRKEIPQYNEREEYENIGGMYYNIFKKNIS